MEALAGGGAITNPWLELAGFQRSCLFSDYNALSALQQQAYSVGRSPKSGSLAKLADLPQRCCPTSVEGCKGHSEGQLSAKM